jgi:hypothetical protein
VRDGFATYQRQVKPLGRGICSLARLLCLRTADESAPGHDGPGTGDDQYEARVRSLTNRFKQAVDESGEEHAMTYQQLQREALQAERSAVIGLRNRGEINDEILRRIERELDLAEQPLAGEAGKT